MGSDHNFLSRTTITLSSTKKTITLIEVSFVKAPTSFSFSDAFIAHALFTGAFFCLISPPTEPVTAVEAKKKTGFICSHRHCERREDKEKELM